MYKIIIAVCLVCTLPLLAITVHDGYFIYLDINKGEDDAFKLSEIGWLWQNYSIESHDWARENLNEELWLSVIVPILKKKAFDITAIFAVCSYTILLLPKLLSLHKGRNKDKVAKGQEQNFAFNIDDIKKNDIRNKGKGSVDYKRNR